MTTENHVSKWFSSQQLDQFFEKVHVGDILEIAIENGNYHFAVYLGHENINSVKKHLIAHCQPNSNCCQKKLPDSSVFNTIVGIQDTDNPCTVCKAYVNTFTDDINSIRIMNELDKDCQPYSEDEILSRALSQCSEYESSAYSFRSFNSCKHFVLWCRYDENYINLIKENTQKKASAIKTGMLVGAIGAAASGLGYVAYSLSKKEKQDTENKKKDKTDKT